jgi:Uma2 family endonuclease
LRLSRKGVIDWSGMEIATEIVLPETKPASEWVGGRALQKMSPTRMHGRLQGLLFAALNAWASAGHHGHVSLEWRFRVQPPGEMIRPLVPDVAYLSYAVIPADGEAEWPLASPTVAFEVLSPDDRPVDIAEKIATYLHAGSSAVVIVDPSDGTITVHDARGARTLTSDQVFEHAALAGFALDIAALFVDAKR